MVLSFILFVIVLFIHIIAFLDNREFAAEKRFYLPLTVINNYYVCRKCRYRTITMLSVKIRGPTKACEILILQAFFVLDHVQNRGLCSVLDYLEKMLSL
jgi:hypothetical protein